MSITTVGKELIANLISTSTSPNIISMAIGTGTPGATALGTEVSRKNLRMTCSGAVATYKGEWDLEDRLSANITEAGLFNSESASGGTMLCSQSFAAINKGVNDSLIITWTVTIS
ncbi:MAG: hypothetical protein WC444_07180 [Candidatus Paceibacterota bacterium]